MGFNSVLMIMNDHLWDIEKDENFGKSVAQAIRAYEVPREYQPYLRGARVLSVHHADNLAIIAAGGNTGRIIGWNHYRASDDVIIKALNDERLRKKREDKLKGSS